MFIFYSLFLLSGFAGIIYEIIWIRIFTDITGSSTQSISAVVTAFLLGLGIGSYVLGKYVDKSKRPLRVYSFTEAGTALFMVLNYFLFSRFRLVYKGLYTFLSYTAIKWNAFFIALIFIAVPAFFIGGTLPVLSRALIRYSQKIKDKIGTLYSINTLGASAGALICGLFLIKMWGYTSTLFFCAGINILIAVSFLLLERIDLLKNMSVRKTAQLPEGSEGSEHAYSPTLLGLVAFFSGFTALGYEIIWSRIFSFLTKGWLIGFSIILSLYLLGVAVGSRFLVRSIKKNAFILKIIGISHLIIVALAVLIMLIMISPSGTFSFLDKFFLMIPIIFITTTIMGIFFPLLSALYCKKMSILGYSVGSIYFFNVLGNVAGSMFAGFIFIPLMGTEMSYALLVLINTLIFGTIFYASRAGAKRYMAFCIMAFLFSPVLFLGRVARDRSFFRGYYDNRYRKNYEIIYSFENYLDTKVVIKKAGLKYLLAGPFLSGSTESKRQSVQTLQGHIPMLLTQGKENILEIGYGVGQIARSIYRYRPADFDIVEIDPDMVRIANRFFNEVNDRVTDKKGVRVSIMDGRHFLDIQDKQYDLIMSDTFFIFSEASTRLYTLEHFTRARKHLKEGGLCLCWIPGNMGVLPGLSIIKTFQTVFPDLLAWRYPEKKSSDIFLIGRKGKKKFSLSQFFNRYRKTARNDLMRVGIKDPYELLSGFFNIKEIMPAVCGSRAILLHIEDKPFLDFAFSMDISRKLLDDEIKEYFFKDDTGWLDEYFSFHDLPGEKIKIRRQKFRAIQHLR